ncbi:hypothetical protein PR048_024321 [Dryococelus australis]|uniref:DUF5641 domain-containing protein n=1 Tax=Dryococelus australis TaxID=614101 RepID=A0ABQ9GND2_9NEOP|nr:hypothetical protein PR048_024321 [Dryococelus australis]
MLAHENKSIVGIFGTCQLPPSGVILAQWLWHSPSTKMNQLRFLVGSLPDFCTWESCQMIPVSLPLHSGAAPHLPYEIRTLSKHEDWHYVPGEQNPADLPSHGCSAECLGIVKLIVWMLWFLKNASKSENHRRGNLVVEEIEEAERRHLHLVQREEAEEIDGKWMKSLCTFVDSDSLMRLSYKIVRREHDECYRYPILLPSKHKLVDILIHNYHVKNSHKHSMPVDIQGYVWSKRYESRKITTNPVTLPEDRVSDVLIFGFCGVDMAGPLNLKGGEKAWIPLFTCAVYWAVHFQLVLSLSTGIFLQGLHRFIARLGRPSVMYSDNRTNSIGTDNGFDSLDWSNIEEESCSQRIHWKFIPPTDAWWDLSQYLSEDTKDLVSLTPTMFPQDNRPIGVPDIDHLEKASLCKRARSLRRLREDLRRRFRNEYLGLLVQHKNETKGPKAQEIGDVVLIGSYGKRRLEWLVGRILEMYPGKDGYHNHPLEGSASQVPQAVAETRDCGTVRGDNLQEEGELAILCRVKTKSGCTVRLSMKFKTQTSRMPPDRRDTALLSRVSDATNMVDLVPSPSGWWLVCQAETTSYGT